MHSVIEEAKIVDVDAIVHIRDEARIHAYPDVELGITRQQIELSSRGKDGTFAKNRARHLRELLSSPDTSSVRYFVARANRKVIGYASVETNAGKHAIENIYVDPIAQGQGVGGLLMTAVLKVLGDKEDISLEVVAYNKRAINFYKKYGFEQVGEPYKHPDPEAPSYVISLPQIKMCKPSKNASK